MQLIMNQSAVKFNIKLEKNNIIKTPTNYALSYWEFKRKIKSSILTQSFHARILLMKRFIFSLMSKIDSQKIRIWYWHYAEQRISNANNKSALHLYHFNCFYITSSGWKRTWLALFAHLFNTIMFLKSKNQNGYVPDVIWTELSLEIEDSNLSICFYS